MRWALFQQVMQKLVEVRELAPRRDASAYAEHLLGVRPELFAAIDGGVSSVRARMAARTIALDHLREIRRLLEYVDALERSLAIATMSPSSRLVRVSALAYLLCEHDLHREGLPRGYGLLDDCIAIRGAIFATPGKRPPGSLGRLMLAEMLRIRYLGLALPLQALAATEAALTYSAELAASTRGMSRHAIERAVLHLVQHPPKRFPAELPLPEPDQPIAVETVLHLVPAKLVEVDDEDLLFAFSDGTCLRRCVHGVLSET